MRLRPRRPFEPEMVLIPGGPFLMGSDPARDAGAGQVEMPQHTLALPDFYLARTPVTNAQYAIFLRATRHPPPRHWRWLFIKHRYAPPGRPRHPVVYVTWHDALAYCRWLAELTGKPYALPSEAEWEKGARGTDGRRFPWGDDWRDGRCNLPVEPESRKQASPVDAYPEGASPYGLLDTLGNVWEWTRTIWGRDLLKPAFDYPYDPADGREALRAGRYVRRVLRGVSFYNDRGMARCAARYRYSPYNCYDSVGFRVAISAA